MNRFVVVAFGVTLMALAGCTHAPAVRDATTVRAVADGGDGAGERWRAIGRLAVKAPAGGGNAHFEWLQVGRHADVTIEGPLGVGHLHLLVSPQRVRLETGSAPAEEYVPPFDGLEERLNRGLGMAVPLWSTAFWLQGRPDPQLPLADVPGGFEQAGFTVQVEGGAGPGRPSRVTVSAADSRLRVVIDRWETLPND